MLNKNKGVYSVYSVDSEGSETLLHNQNNIIPNNGLDLICSSGSETLIHTCVVSADSTEVTQTTNQIPTIVATTSNVLSRDYGAQDSEPYFYWHRTTFEFSPGAANGNLTKIGITNSSGSVFSVSLFKDAEGKPTTIQPIDNERLKVVYEHRVYIEPEDVIVKTVDVYKDKSVEFTFTIRPAWINRSTVAQNLNRGLYIESYSHGSDRPLIAYTGPIGSVASTPSEYYSYENGISASSYINGSHVRNYSLNLGYNGFNTNSKGISSFMFTTSRGCYQIGIDPPLQKDNSQHIFINFPISMRS